MPGSLIEQARNEIRQVRDWLLRPAADTMNACVPALEHAVRCLEEVSRLEASELPSTPQSGPLRLLADEIRQVQALFQTAGQLYFGAMRQVSNAPELSPGQPAEPISTLG